MHICIMSIVYIHTIHICIKSKTGAIIVYAERGSMPALYLLVYV